MLPPCPAQREGSLPLDISPGLGPLPPLLVQLQEAHNEPPALMDRVSAWMSLSPNMDEIWPEASIPPRVLFPCGWRRLGRAVCPQPAWSSEDRVQPASPTGEMMWDSSGGGRQGLSV